MFRLWPKLISFSLAAIYVVLAAAGDSLHAFLPCEDSCCVVVKCECGRPHFDWNAAKQQATGDGFRVPQHGHDHANCALCTLLGQLKVAGPALAPVAIEPAVIEQSRPLLTPVRATSLAHFHSARGPPAHSA